MDNLVGVHAPGTLDQHNISGPDGFFQGCQRRSIVHEFPAVHLRCQLFCAYGNFSGLLTDDIQDCLLYTSYVGGGMAVDARDEASDMVYHNVSSKSWQKWFKVAGVNYPTTGWQTFEGNRYYYENGQYIVNCTRVIDGKTYTFNSSGIANGGSAATSDQIAQAEAKKEAAAAEKAEAQAAAAAAAEKAAEEEAAAKKKAEEEAAAKKAAEEKAKKEAEEKAAAEKKAAEDVYKRQAF